MYFYIYDSFLVEKKQSKFVSKIETRLASLDIAGKKHQLSILRSVKDMVGRILQKESPTIIIIGKDKTLCEAGLSVAGTNAVLGFIPTESDSSIADLLGIPVNEYACDVVSSRRIQKISLGKINNQNFFSSLEFDANKVILIADDKYEIIPKKIKTVKVVNLDFLRFQKKQGVNVFQKVSNPKDNYLEVLMGRPEKKIWPFNRKEEQDSLFFVKKLRVMPRKSEHEILIKADKDKIIKTKTPVMIELDNKRINVIVGKDRLI